MGTQTTAAVLDYLRSRAPDFFAERVRSATDADVARLEQAAGVRMSEGHREFLRVMGNTPAGVLNPFVNDRDFSIDNLIAEYASMRTQGFVIPKGFVYFSSSEITGSTIFLKQADEPTADPEIGDLAPDTRRFIPHDAQHFEAFLRWHAFHFRMNQLDEELLVGPRWDPKTARWEADLERSRDAVLAEGFEPVFGVPESYCEYFEDDGIAIALYHAGGMAVAGDDPEVLRSRAEALAGPLGVTSERVPGRTRLRAPRD